jgi:hypothetical protein
MSEPEIDFIKEDTRKRKTRIGELVKQIESLELSNQATMNYSMVISLVFDFLIVS